MYFKPLNLQKNLPYLGQTYRQGHHMGLLDMLIVS